MAEVVKLIGVVTRFKKVHCLILSKVATKAFKRANAAKKFVGCVRIATYNLPPDSQVFVAAAKQIDFFISMT